MSEVGAILVGVAGGAIAGMLGVGGGILFVPGFAVFLGFSQVDAEAASLLAIIPVAVVGVIRQRRYGNVRLADGLIVGALSPLGAVAGVAIANAVSQRVLELGFAALLLFVAARFVDRAIRGSTPGPEAAAADPAAGSR